MERGGVQLKVQEGPEPDILSRVVGVAERGSDEWVIRQGDVVCWYPRDDRRNPILGIQTLEVDAE
jgi:hypothetical protein